MSIRRVPKTPTPAGLEESTAVHLQLVRHYAPHLYRWTFLALSLEERETQQYTSHLHCSTPPICTAVRLPFVRQYASHLYGSTLRKYWGLGSPESSLVLNAVGHRKSANASAKERKRKYRDGCTPEPVSQAPPSYGLGRYGFGFFGPRIAFRATCALRGRATPFLYHFSGHLSSVSGRTQLCREVWTPGPQKPQTISNENHHLALLE